MKLTDEVEIKSVTTKSDELREKGIVLNEKLKLQLEKAKTLRERSRNLTRGYTWRWTIVDNDEGEEI